MRCSIALTALLGFALFPPKHHAEPFGTSPTREQGTVGGATFTLPPGFVIEKIAGPPLVEHPMMGGFDPEGRLFLAESAGQNLKAQELLKDFPNFIRALEPADEQGVFRKSRIWADKMTFPMGALWHRGALYAASPPSLWRLLDSKGAGIATIREEVVAKFGFTGNAADIHGPFLGPDGRLYWCDGRHGHEITRPDGTMMKGKAARVFRCKPDGSNVEVVCGGGMDNPVEIAFTPECEPFVTVDILHTQPARNDAIIFALEGSVYPYHEVYKEFPRTGDLLPAVADLGWVAPSGLMRYRGDMFGKEYYGNLFSAQFNRNRIQRHIVERQGASFQVKTEDFLTSSDRNFHATDVLEDADGGLLVIDTGGWFRIGCPTSKIAQPEIKGGIYRIKKQGMSPVMDPRGLKVQWDNLSPTELVAYLDDARFMVRDRAVDQLAQASEKAIPALRKTILKAKSPRECRNAVWALTRIEHPDARAAVRLALTDKDLSVRLAALHSAGLLRDEEALPQLLKALGAKEPAVVRQAATALGRLRRAAAVPALMQAMEKGGDRFLEHALVYALIQINDPAAVAVYLKQPSPAVRRAALVALDQMPAGNLSREQVTPLLATADPALLKAVLAVIANRPAWGSEIVDLAKNWLAQPKAEPNRQESLRGLLIGLGKDKAIQAFVGQTLAKHDTPIWARLVLLDGIAQAPVEKMPQAWIEQLRQSLNHSDPQVALQTIAVIRQRNLVEPKLEVDMKRLAASADHTPELRIAAFAAVAPRWEMPGDNVFQLLTENVHPEKPPLLRLAAASALGRMKSLSEHELEALTHVLASAGPLELPHLLAPFEKAKDKALGEKLLAALARAPGLTSVSPAALEKAVDGFPAQIKERAKPLFAKLQVDHDKQRARLEELDGTLTGGDVELGKNVFFGPKASCFACHTAQGKGAHFGPDLSKISAVRSGRDLLEALVFPSASFARGYEPFLVETKAGQLHTGILARETGDALFLVTGDRQEIRVPRTQLESLAPGRVSIMPQGMDVTLTREELRNLMAYLQSLR
ncbi:MAG: HEAT repeat domain-containing protein [Gemmataceae bacterium]|nr:HEAT repeat domain-containing protein [Gemmataceae bacterium]